MRPRLERLRRRLLDVDPGGMRLIQATKTVVAVLVALVLLRQADLLLRLFAGLAAATLLQCVGAGDARYQRLCMLVSGAASTALVALGGGLGGLVWAKDALLVAIACAAFEARRRLPDHAAFPMFGFVLCVLSTALTSGLDQSLRAAGAVALGLAIAYPLFFFVASRPDYPRPAAAPDARASLRAAIAALLAIALAEAFALERSYWAILVAVLITAETLHAHVRMAVERFGATAVACAIGALVHLAVRTAPTLEIVFMLVCIFLAIFYRQASYAWMTFFLTLYVVFLFATLGEWTPHILLVRVYETGIGGAVSIAARVLVPSSDADA